MADSFRAARRTPGKSHDGAKNVPKNVPRRNLDWKQTAVALAYVFAVLLVVLASERLYRALLGRGVPEAVAHGIRSLLAMAAIFVAARLSWRTLGGEWATAGWRDLLRVLPLLILAAVIIEVVRAFI